MSRAGQRDSLALGSRRLRAARPPGAARAPPLGRSSLCSDEHEAITEGVDVISKLRANEETADTPIILMTSVDMRSSFGGSLDESLPIQNYLVKPVDPTTLVKSVKDHIRK